MFTRHLPFPRRQASERVGAPTHQLAHDLRVHDCPALGDLAQRRGELLNIGYPVFEQVTDPAAVAGVEQVGSVA